MDDLLTRQQVRRFPYQPSIEPLYECATRIREIYIASCKRVHETSDAGQPIRASNRPSAKMYYQDDSTSERDLFLLACHALWRTDLKFLFHGSSSEDVVNVALVGLELLRQESEPEVQLSISRTTASLFLLSSLVPPDSEIYEQARVYNRRSTCVAVPLCSRAIL